MVYETDEILKNIEELTHAPGCMYALAEIISQDMFFESGDMTAVNRRERISYQEASFLLGLFIKQDSFSDTPPSSEQIQKLVKDTRDLMEKLHRSYTQQVGKIMREVTPVVGGDISQSVPDTEKDARFEKIFGSKASMVEAVFYDDSGAYDIQFLEMAPKLYQFDKNWLASRGLNLNHANAIHKAIKTLTKVQHHFYVNPEDNPKGRLNGVLDQFIFHRKDILKVANELNEGIALMEKDVEVFLSFFIAQPGEQNKSLRAPGELNIIHIKPVLHIAPEAYFIPLRFNLAEAIYKNPGYLMLEDEGYKDKAANNRGEANEAITFDYFKKVFGEFAFKSTRVLKGKKILTDIDVMGVIGSVAVIVQNKSKRMTVKSRQGDEEYLKKDFRQAIQDAYGQGITSRKAILQNKQYKFVDPDGNEIILPYGIKQVFILCITADVYPAVLFQVKTYLNKKENDPWPLPLSLFDLDILAEYLPDPYSFTFYVKQRIELMDIILAEGEMSLLAYHLKQKLLRPESMSHLFVSSDLANLIDADYMYRKGQSEKPSAEDSLQNDWNNKTYNQILAELKTNISDPRLTDIIFFLKTLPPDTVDAYVENMNKIRKSSNEDRQPRDMSMPLSYDNQPWGGITCVTESDPTKLRQKLGYLATINKYRHKSDKWIGMGSMIGQSNLIDCVLFLEEEWEQSEEMDVMLERHNRYSTGKFVKPEGMEQAKTPVKQKPAKKRGSQAAKKRMRKLRKKAQRKNRKK